MPRRESVHTLIDRSSLGAPVVRRLRARTDPAVRARILRRAKALAASGSADDLTRSSRN
jgi:hypothetical protein